MTSFVHVDQPTVHPGVRRAEVLFGQIQAARAGANGTRPLIALLIVAIAAAVLVVTDSLVSNWNEGGVLAVWTVFCLAAIALFALFASSVRQSSVAGPGAPPLNAVPRPVPTPASWKPPRATRA
jgi:hypothetical protein